MTAAPSIVPGSSTPDPERPTLLIVDDERGPAESLRMIFKPTFNVFIAPRGDQAIEIVRTTPIDVVTLDLRMPGMPGTEVMEHIRRVDPDIEIIVVTGFASLDSAIRGLRHRVFDYVTKPFDVPQITELVERAVARRRANLRAKRITEDLLANLSHELRTPLSAIIGYNTILTEELYGCLTEEQRVAFDRIQQNSRKLLDLIETVLLLTSLDAGDVELVAAPFDVRETLRRTARQFAAAARQRGLTLTVEGEATPLWVESDEHKLERIVSALVDNAIKFTPHGFVALSARLTGDGSTFEVEVRDSGVGLPPETLSRVSEGAATLGELPQGLGLGLRVATRLTEFLGGRLRARSLRDSGSQFTVALPRHVSSAAPRGYHQA